MKIRYVLLTTISMIAGSIPMYGHPIHADSAKIASKQHEMSAMMGKPTVDAIVEGLHMKVWLMTQEQHKQMMNAMPHEGMMMNDTSMKMSVMHADGTGMDKATKEAMMAGTHLIVLEATDAKSGKEPVSSSARVSIVSPSKKKSTIDLRSMMTHFGNGLTLEEKGRYQLTVSINVKGISKTKNFHYDVK